ncbi:MAG TPA: methylmalonyl-CoA epimerase [Anaerolineales bacterium]|nr:methylmalonyl-CoA epimerase [Anaerolineales bacterium]
MAKVLRIDHIAILVNEMDGPLSFWRDALGLELTHIQDVPAEMAKTAFLPVSGSEVELVQPTSDDSGLARFLEKRGPGMHHICLEVDDIVEMLAQLKEKGVQLINEEYRTGHGGRKYAFIHPKSASGVMVELYELPK